MSRRVEVVVVGGSRVVVIELWRRRLGKERFLMGQAKEYFSGGGAYVLRSLPTSTEKGGHDVHVKPTGTWTYLISSAIQPSDMIKLFFVVYGMLCQKAKQHLRATNMSVHHHQCSMRETHRAHRHTIVGKLGHDHVYPL